MQLIEPSEQRTPEDPTDALVREGVPAADAQAWASVFGRLLAFVPSESPDSRWSAPEEIALGVLVRAVAGAFKELGDCPAAAHLEAMREVTRMWAQQEWLPPGVKESRWAWSERGTRFGPRVELLRHLVRPWREATNGLDLTPGLAIVAERNAGKEDPHFARMAARWLCGRRIRPGRSRPALLHPTQALDLDMARLEAGAKHGFQGREQWESGRLEFWFSALGSRAYSVFASPLETEAPETVGTLAWGLVARFDLWALSNSEGGRRAGLRPADLLAIFAVVRQRLEEGPDDIDLLGAYWVLARKLMDLGQALPPGEDERVIATARRGLGTIRPLLRDAHIDEEASAKAFRRALLPLMDALRIVVRVDGLWPALRALLLALRASSVPAVASDLRYWSESPREDPPQPWSFLASQFVGLLHAHARDAEANDPELVALREALASHLLERLKAKGGKQVEESTAWRQCTVRAIQELRVNPRGKGHHVLNFAAKNDPNEDVRKAAAVAHEEMRRGVLLPPGSSPRRAILAAFWWLRQAHLLALGSRIDPHGAQRTRQKETRRTKEEEDSNTVST